MIKRRIGALGIILAVIFLAACPKQDVIRKLAVVSKESSAAIKLFQQNEIQSYNAGLVSKEDHKAVQEILVSVGEIGLALDMHLRIAANDAQALDGLNLAIKDLDVLTVEISEKIKDESTKTKFLIAIAGVRSALSTTAALLGGQ